MKFARVADSSQLANRGTSGHTLLDRATATPAACILHEVAR
jgi:hypothetical protein